MAWAFLGLDASLMSLHVEPEHRGRGLAVPVSRRMFLEGLRGGVFGGGDGGGGVEEGAGAAWAHADVGRDNVPSRRVMERVGGEVMWEVCWVEVELEKM